MTRATGLLRDWWLPLALGVLAVHEVGDGYDGLGVPGPTLLAGLLPLVLVTGRRRHEPVLVAVAVSLLAVVYAIGVQGDAAVQPPLAAFLALLVAMFSLGLHGAGPRFLPGTVLALSLVGLLQVASAVAGQSVDDVLPSTVFLAGALVVGRLIHRSRADAERSRQLAVASEQARERHVAEAIDAERTRLARELHDVVAHSLSLVVVQASVESRLLPDQRSSAASTLRSIEHQGRAALTELRRLLGLLRENGDGELLRPLPTIGRLEDLVADVRRAGHRVEVTVDAGLAELPPGIDLAAYRVVQEALTNAARHAPGSDVEVAVGQDGDEVVVTVVNGVPTSSLAGVPGAGHGLAGMRERVRLYGGSVESGPTGAGGFRIEARLPLGPS